MSSTVSIVAADEGHRVTWMSAGLSSLPDDDGWMDEAERARISSMRYTKRRTESSLARHTAKVTLANALGLGADAESLARVAIRNAADGAPEAFVDDVDPGVVISMTDRADWAVCAVLHGDVRVGCDLELVEHRSEPFITDYFTPDETRFALSLRGERRHEVANVIWSAKESALKVLRTGLRRDTRSVEVRLGFEERRGWASLVAETDGVELSGWWRRYGEFVLTFVAAAPIARPESLIDPPPLASALPSHSWMNDPRR